MALKPDVLLMDVSMPGLNGLQATAAVRQRAPGVKMLTLTRHARRATWASCCARAGRLRVEAEHLRRADQRDPDGRQRPPVLDPELNHGLMGLFGKAAPSGSRRI